MYGQTYTEIQLYPTQLEIFSLFAPNMSASSYSPNKPDSVRCYGVGRRAEFLRRQAELLAQAWA